MLPRGDARSDTADLLRSTKLHSDLLLYSIAIAAISSASSKMSTEPRGRTRHWLRPSDFFAQVASFAFGAIMAEAVTLLLSAEEPSIDA